MKEVKKIYDKVNGKWILTNTIDNAIEVYQDLAHDLTAKKLRNAKYIRSIKYNCRYDNTCDITVYYDNGVKAVYIVKD